MVYNGQTRHPCSVESVAESPCELVNLASVHKPQPTYGSIGYTARPRKLKSPLNRSGSPNCSLEVESCTPGPAPDSCFSMLSGRSDGPAATILHETDDKHM